MYEYTHTQHSNNTAATLLTDSSDACGFANDFVDMQSHSRPLFDIWCIGRRQHGHNDHSGSSDALGVWPTHAREHRVQEHKAPRPRTQMLLVQLLEQIHQKRGRRGPPRPDESLCAPAHIGMLPPMSRRAGRTQDADVCRGT